MVKKILDVLVLLTAVYVIIYCTFQLINGTGQTALAVFEILVAGFAFYLKVDNIRRRNKTK